MLNPLVLDMLALACSVFGYFCPSPPQAPPPQQTTGTVIFIGDSITHTHEFIPTPDEAAWQLGEYEHLRSALDFWGGSFGLDRIAARPGYHTYDVLAEEPECGGLSRVECAIERHAPSVAIVMLGTNDLGEDVPIVDILARYQAIIDVCRTHGVSPVVMTIPPICGERGVTYNQQLWQLAVDNGLPVLDYEYIMLGLPSNGLSDDMVHPSTPPDGCTTCFDAAHLEYGYTVRNLLVLEYLYQLIP